MTTALEKKYDEMSVEELKARAEELRHDYTALHEGDRGGDFSERHRGLINEVNLLDTNLTLALATQKRAFEQETAPSAATGVHGAGHGFRSIGELIMDAEPMREWIEAGMTGGAGGRAVTEFLINGSVEGVRALTEFGSGGPGNNATNDVNFLLPVGQPIPPVPRQAQLFIRDLMPVQPTTLTQVPYVKELNPTALEFGASAVAEGNVKPDVGINFVPATAFVTVIAGNVSPTKQLWEDAPLVVAYINQRLPYLVKFKEDWEFLNGSGTYPDIEGILNAGCQTQTASAGDPAVTIGNSIAKVELVDGVATAVVMNPTDAWTMFTKRAAGGSGTFDAGTPFSNIPMTVWGLPVKRSRAYAAGHALVGDWQRGGMILDREQVNVQIYPQHSDYAARNQVLVQCEERVGALWFRPDFFVNSTL